MRKSIWTLTAVALTAMAFATPSAMAAQASNEEAIGIGAGGVIGAVAGGPVGFIVGAAIGAKLGDTMHKKNVEIDTLSASLETREATVADLEYDVATLAREIDRVTGDLKELKSASRPELVNLLEAGIAMDLLFRTDEHVLADTTGSRLGELAETIAAMPDLHVSLDGFTDERGATEYNQALSQKRVDYVRDRLLDAGVDASRITSRAHGEAAAEDETADSLALERRVSLKLFIADAPSFASNPD